MTSTLSARTQLINSLVLLGNRLSQKDPNLDKIIKEAFHHNGWFTFDNINNALQAISSQFLVEEKLSKWLAPYSFDENSAAKTIGVIMAGNLPLAGFHDFLCVLISGNLQVIKLSSKDKILLPYIHELLSEIDPENGSKVEFIETLKDFDAVIATGSDNSALHFEYYFGKHPHIIRKNRTSIGILDGNETKEELALLGNDIFQYYGLGCRNISKLYVPPDYNFSTFFEAIDDFSWVMANHKYKNNYDYNRTLLLMNKEPHLSNDFLILRENDELVSPLASTYYEHYHELETLKEHLAKNTAAIQCISTNTDIGKRINNQVVPLGKTQLPDLWDYADDIDTLQFLQQL